MKKILTLVIVLLPIFSMAQNVKTSTIKWNSQRTFNVATGQWTEENSSLTNHSTTSMEWKNNDGTTRNSFQIIEAIGDWTNAASDGRVQFEVKDGETRGTVRISRKNQETKVLIVLATEPPELYELTIQSMQQL